MSCWNQRYILQLLLLQLSFPYPVYKCSLRLRLLSHPWWRWHYLPHWLLSHSLQLLFRLDLHLHCKFLQVCHWSLRFRLQVRWFLSWLRLRFHLQEHIHHLRLLHRSWMSCWNQRYILQLPWLPSGFLYPVYKCSLRLRLLLHPWWRWYYLPHWLLSHSLQLLFRFALHLHCKFLQGCHWSLRFRLPARWFLSWLLLCFHPLWHTFHLHLLHKL